PGTRPRRSGSTGLAAPPIHGTRSRRTPATDARPAPRDGAVPPDRLRRAIDQFDPGHGRSVALARTQLQDPRVAPLAFGEPGSDVVEQGRHDVAVGDLLQNLPARGEVPALGLGDQAFRVRP